MGAGRFPKKSRIKKAKERRKRKGSGWRLPKSCGRNRELGGECGRMTASGRWVLTKLGFSGHVRILIFI